MASIRVSAEEAESLRAWATAYIKMELEEHPNGTNPSALRQARDEAHTHINRDLKWVLKNVHTDAPGNYNPVIKANCAMRQAELKQPCANNADSPSAAQQQSTHPNITSDNNIKLNYNEGE